METMETIAVNDPIENVKFTGKILKVETLENGAEFLSVRIEELGNISLIRWPDGLMFSTTDWQSKQPSSDDIEGYEWMDLESGHTAVMLNGVPRKMF